MPCALTMMATSMCEYGVSPMPLLSIPMGAPVMAGGMLALTLPQVTPYANVLPFALCESSSNPLVDLIGTAPCTPMTVLPWLPDSFTVLVNGEPWAFEDSLTMCAYAGEISVLIPSQFTVQVGL